MTSVLEAMSPVTAMQSDTEGMESVESANLDVLPSIRATKIVGTLGPASIPKVRELIIAGLNCFRLNFSHITDPTLQTPIIDEIRKQSANLNIPVSILGDLCGPKIRCNDFHPLPSINLIPDSTVELKVSDGPGSEGVITTKIGSIIQQLQEGNRVLLDDGNIKLTALESVNPGGDSVRCKVVVGGVLKPRKGINVPDLKLDIPALTEKDKADARFMFQSRIDYVALSFVQRKEDVLQLIQLFEEERKASDRIDDEDGLEDGWRPKIISKIEKPQALEEIDEIIEVSDGIMVARGDLGVEVSLEKVPVIQKMLIRKANLAEKPVITATQMLESMISSPVPTRAEVSDVANAVFDGTDAVMLSAECAVGEYPIETVKMMGSICHNAEQGAAFAATAPLDFDPTHKLKGISAMARPIADASVAAAAEANASAIITFTISGAMAVYVSKRRPHRRIIAVTPTVSIYRRLPLLYGVYPVLSTFMKINSKHSHLKKTFGIPHSKFNATLDISQATSTPNGDHSQKNTDSIYSQTEKDILTHSENLKSLAGGDNTDLIRVGDVAVFACGKYPLAGLNYTLKMTRFGDAIKSERRRHLWDNAFDWYRLVKIESPLSEESPLVVISESPLAQTNDASPSPPPQKPSPSPIFSPTSSPELPLPSSPLPNPTSPSFQIVVVEAPTANVDPNGSIQAPSHAVPTNIQINPNAVPAVPGNLGDNQVVGGGSAGGSANQPTNTVSFPGGDSTKSESGGGVGVTVGVIGAVAALIAVLAIAGFVIYKRRSTSAESNHSNSDAEFASISTIKSAWPKHDSQPPVLRPIVPVRFGEMTLNKFASRSNYQNDNVEQIRVVQVPPLSLQQNGNRDSIMSDDPVSANELEVNGVADAARKIAGVQSRDTYLSTEYEFSDSSRRDTTYLELTDYNNRRDTYKSGSDIDSRRDTFMTDSDYDKNRQTTYTVYTDFSGNSDYTAQPRDTIYTEASFASQSSSSSSNSANSKFSFTDSETSDDSGSSGYEPNARDTMYTEFTEVSESSDRRLSDLTDTEIQFQPNDPPPYSAGSSVPAVPRPTPPIVYRKAGMLGALNNMVVHRSPLGQNVLNADDLSSDSSGSMSRYSGSSRADRD
ncbi:hypothetical protein HK098_005307 [Nowakowskiella sp. JEL0407]|nr:hypothetical protein HK098_005307 [Nowakowskiella sp. JEL0407]